MATTNPISDSVSEAVDELGMLKAQLAETQARIDEIKAELIRAGVSHAHGSLFQVSISSYSKNFTDWKSVALDLSAPKELIDYHSRSSIIQSLRVSARS